jgi:hypothetical protein
MGQLREIKHVKQDDDNLLKKWFTDDSYWDLYVWYSKITNKIIGIQLCYSRGAGERALTWFENKEFSHKAVSTRRDHKGYRGDVYGSPILVPDGGFDNRGILENFIIDSTGLDEEIINVVKKRIMEFKNS